MAAFAKKIKGQLSQRIQNELASRRRARRDAVRDTFATRLLNAMDIVLSPEKKEAVLSKAEELKDEEIAA